MFLAGDVMTGRGIDQILPHPSRPELHERWVRSAEEYVALAEKATGPIPRGVGFDYVWGDALAELERARPDARIVNLETAVTTSEDEWPGKEIRYRMHPGNVPCLAAARIDCCALANNHVLDFGYAGLAETLAVLDAAGIRTAGAGRDAAEAALPAEIPLAGGGRVLVYSFGLSSSGVRVEWAATEGRAGVFWVEGSSGRTIETIARRVTGDRRRGDVAVASLHWGGNWGYSVPATERELAHRLIDAAGIDLVHGHSSHHAKAIEVHRGKAILYGCGDLIDDYEGIGGYESFRSELGLLYFATLDAASGDLVRLSMTPTRMRHFRIHRADEADAAWLAKTLTREGAPLGTEVVLGSDGLLELRLR